MPVTIKNDSVDATALIGKQISSIIIRKTQ